MKDQASIGPALASAEIEAEAEETEAGEFRVALLLAVPQGKEAAEIRATGLGKAIRDALVQYGDLAQSLLDSRAEIDVEEFMRIVADVMRASSSTSVQPASQFTEEEANEFAAAGFDAAPAVPREADPIAHTAARYSELLATALSTESAARLLDVEDSRIRQRLQEGTLYGVKIGRNWRLPSFQFTARGVVPGVEHVFPRLDATLHPVAVYRWFVEPNRDLVYEDRAVSPRDWLLSGADPIVVGDLAEDL
jgi:excisionase family DNA binding protein